MGPSLATIVGTAGAALGLALTALGPVPAPASESAAATWSLDPSFSDDGVVTTGIPGGHDEADWPEGVAIQPDGRIVVAGTHHNFGGDEDSGDIVVVRYREDGTLDRSFAAAGTLRMSIGRFDDVRGVTVQEVGGDTKIVIVGHLYSPSSPGPSHQAFVVRLNEDGTLDTDEDSDPSIHLDHDGIATIGFRHGGFGTAVAIDPDNRIVVAGYAILHGLGRDSPAAARLLPLDGALDQGFGSDGMTMFRPVHRVGHASDIAIQRVGSSYRIVVAGWATAPKGYNWLVSALRQDGSLDLTFGEGDGHTLVPMRSKRVYQSFEGASGVAVGPDGTITAVGEARVWKRGETQRPTDVPAMARLTSSGELDPSFSVNGKARLVHTTGGPPNRIGNDVVLGADGIAYWVGTVESPVGGDAEAALVGGRLPDGSPDPTFGAEGYLSVSYGPSADDGDAITLDSRGRLLIMGRSDFGSYVQAAFGVARLRLR